MTPEDLLRVEPKVLAKLILHKRERISHSLPKTIESIAAEKHTAENLARRSRNAKEEIEPKFNNLLKERNQVVQSISNAVLSIELTTEDNSEISKLVSGIESDKTTSNHYSKKLEKITNICSKYNLNIENLQNYNTSVKANQALSELTSDYEKAKNDWNENESHRRRLESKFTKLSTNLADSEKAKEFWQQKIDSNFDELLIDAKRVAEGGPSSRQISRNRKQTNSKRRSQFVNKF